jgi:RNA polymerase sigma factor (sigma-70 family)
MSETAARSDGELLGDFALTGNESAFSELVHRHGAMVRNVCRRVLSDYHEAEDVAQAVFLTLARKAGGLRRSPSVGGWLHRVAWCLAMDVRKARVRRNRREDAAMREMDNGEGTKADLAAFRAEVDAALAELPDRYRRPLVLFHLEERSAEDSARVLGLNPITLRTRLNRARERLRRKLVRRGVAVGSIGALTTLLSAEAGAAVLPATFVSATAKAASLAAAGKLAAGVGAGAISPHVAALTKGAMNMIFWGNVQTAAVLTAAGVVVAGTGAVVAQKAVEPAADVAATKHIGNRDSGHTMLRRRLESIVIPGWRITEEPLTKAVAKLADAIKANDPAQAGVAIELDPPTPSLRLQMFTLLTMESRGVPTTAMQILRGMAEMSQQRIAFENNRVVLSPLHPDRTTVVIAEVEFRDAPVSEVVRSLQSRTGVPIRLQRTGNLPLVTLSAKGIQLDNAVLSIAGQAGLAMGYEEDGFVLK